MTRHLFNLAAALSLVILAMAVVFWVRSYLGQSVWFVPDRGTLLVAGVDRDAESLTAETLILSQTPREWVIAILRGGSATPSFEWLGFGYFRGNPMYGNRPTYDIKIFAIPYWAIALLAAVLPSWWLVRSGRAAGRARGGRCATCGYDLRATPDRCPECGTGAHPSAVAAA